MRKIFIYLFAALPCLQPLTSKAAIAVINTGTPGTPISSPGPVMLTNLGLFKASRYSYLYTQAELATAGITNGSSITALGWMKSNANPTLGGPASFKIWMKNSSATAYSSATETWASLNTGTTLVYQNASQVIPATANPTYIDFTLSSAFTYTGGALEISVEWDATAVTGNPGTGELLWMWSTVPDRIYGTSGQTLAPLTTLSSTTSNTNINDNRPFIQITYTPGGSPVPGCIAAPTAPTGTVCAGPVTLSWPAEPTATGYDVYLDAGATATTLVSSNQPGTTYNANVAVGPYAWMVVPKNSAGPATGCGTFAFTALSTATPSVSIAATPGATICSGTSVTFSSTFSNAGTPTFQWKKNANNVGTNTASYTDASLANGDVITLELTGSGTCISTTPVNSNNITMTVNAAQVVTATASAAPGTSVPAGANVTFTATVTNSTAPVYQWQQNGADIAGAQNATHTMSTFASNDVIRCRVVHGTPCTANDTVYTNSLTMVITNGINSIKKGDVQVRLSPNPNNGSFILAGTMAGGNTIPMEIVNTLGQVLYRDLLIVANGKLNSKVSVHDMSPGLYFVHLYLDRGVETVRFLVE